MSLVRTFRTGLDVETINRHAEVLAVCPNFWIPRDLLEAGDVHTEVEREVCRLLPVLQGILPPSWTGAEFWVQVYDAGKGLAFHFDKDEQRFVDQHVMAHPLLSSVLYLAGDASSARLGPTVVVDQRFDSVLGKATPEVPTRSALVWPVKGHFAVFEGGLGHGVLGTPPRGRRATLLVNWWDHQPQGLGLVPADLVARHDLAGEHRPCDGSGASEPGTAPAEETAVAVLRAPDKDDSPIMVDDLLSAHSMRLLGEGAVSAVTVDHEGFQLFPLDEDALPSCSGGDAQTAAALTATSAGLWAIGDVLSQKIDGTLDKKWDMKRTLLTSAYGGLFIGPVGHTWYQVLDKAARRRFAPGSLKFIATKVIGDEVVFGPVHVAGFFAFMTVAEGGSWQDVKEKLQNDFLSAYLAELAFWPAFQAVNFWKVPVRHQLLAVNLACLVDATFLCWIQNQEDWTRYLRWGQTEATAPYATPEGAQGADQPGLHPDAQQHSAIK
ncbi:hypothetical protein WJX81_005480 [Elliptochloris bilobata]|uniref:Fe2OG dioxygenase domain-containing protein n=1 Tax=Elliptochloris bilobata TaxID=381761 RepID=A0AAW1S887_9CHLO